jgi:hypothetical protein
MEWICLLFALLKTLPAILVSAKRTLRYRHQTHTTNPAHQSVACASTYFRMSMLMRKEASCKRTKSLILGPFFGFHSVKYEFENKMAF